MPTARPPDRGGPASPRPGGPTGGPAEAWRRLGILRRVANPFALAAETVAPARLGRSFRWLLASSVVTNAGDGVALAAGPLLVASLTRDPLLVSMAALAQTLPAAAVRRPGGRHCGPPRPTADRGGREPCPGRGAGPARRHHRRRLGEYPRRPGCAVRPGHRGDVCRRGQQQPAPPPGASRGPRHRECAAAERVPAHQPAAHAAGRGLPVRRRHGAAVRDQRRVLRAGRAARVTDRPAAGRLAGWGLAPKRATSGGHGRGSPLAPRPPADADPRAHDLPVQRHVRGGLVRARPVRGRTARHERGGVRPADHRHGDRRDHRDHVVRTPGAAVRAGRHHAGRPPDRDRDAPGAGADHVGDGRAGRPSWCSGPMPSCGARRRRWSASVPYPMPCWGG